MDSVIDNERTQVFADLMQELGTAPTDEQLDSALVSLTWGNVRKRRNELLDATDWCAHVDSPAMSDEMKTYRQALRDLPASTENSSDVVFPTPPE